MRPDMPPRPAGIDPALVEEMCREAAERARAEAVAEMTAQHEADRAALLDRHRTELEILRAEMAMLAADAVPAAVEARAGAIAEGVAADVARVLAPIVEQAVVSRMVSALANEIRAACSLESAEAIHASGPRSLVDALRDKLGEAGARVTLAETDGPEIVVTMDRARWSTRLQAWSGELAEALR
jgi:hypothetical protein